MSRGSDGKSIELERKYRAALEKHLAAPRGSLRVAGTLGRQALALGVGTTALAKIHKNALVALIPSGEPSRTTNGKISRASTFFIAALKPLDGTNRGTQDSGERMARLKEAMRRNKVELAGTHRKLERELTRRKTLEAALRKSNKQHAQLLKKSLLAKEHLRRLSHRILGAQEDERRRVSRELHDEVGQILTAINVRLAKLETETNLNARALKQTIRSTQRLVEQSLKTVHRFARDLRPPLLDNLGLIPALHVHLDAFTKQTGVPVRFTSFAGVEKLDGNRRTVLYRVAQEALANIAKHARASLVTMSIRRKGDHIETKIHDNGKGFDMQRRLRATRASRLGLIGMRERLEMVGGSLRIESEPSRGTTIHAELPFPAGAAENNG